MACYSDLLQQVQKYPFFTKKKLERQKLIKKPQNNQQKNKANMSTNFQKQWTSGIAFFIQINSAVILLQVIFKWLPTQREQQHLININEQRNSMVWFPGIFIHVHIK